MHAEVLAGLERVVRPPRATRPRPRAAHRPSASPNRSTQLVDVAGGGGGVEPARRGRLVARRRSTPGTARTGTGSRRARTARACSASASRGRASSVRPWKLPSNARTFVASRRAQLIRHSAIAFSLASAPIATNVTCGKPGHELAQRRSRSRPRPRSRRSRCRRSRPACRRTRPRCTRARPDPRRTRRRPSRSGSCRRARPAARRRSTPSTARPTRR